MNERNSRDRRSMRGKFSPSHGEGHKPVAHHREAHHVRTAEGKLVVVDTEAEVVEILQHRLRRKIEGAMQASLDLGFTFRPLQEIVESETSETDSVTSDLRQLSMIVPLSDQSVTLVGSILATETHVRPQLISLVSVTPTTEGKFTIDETILSVDFHRNVFFDAQGVNADVHLLQTGANRLKIMQGYLAHELKAQSMQRLMQNPPIAQ